MCKKVAEIPITQSSMIPSRPLDRDVDYTVVDLLYQCIAGFPGMYSYV